MTSLTELRRSIRIFDESAELEAVAVDRQSTTIIVNLFGDKENYCAGTPAEYYGLFTVMLQNIADKPLPVALL